MSSQNFLPRRTSLVLMATLFGSIPASMALAHHSFGMFDNTKTVTLTGTVREFQFTNPHCFIQLVVPNDDGSGTTEWSIEMSAPAHLIRSGWTRNTVTSGEKVSVQIHPLRDGKIGGSFVSASDAQGKAIGVPTPSADQP